MEFFITEDGTIAKYIHDDNSETSIKVSDAFTTIVDSETGMPKPQRISRNKISAIISSSLGCYMKCSFCHLTIKNSTYAKLTSEAVARNIIEAFENEYSRLGDMSDRYAKLCWMGMGDAINNPDMISDVSIRVFEHLISNKMVKGMDGVDIATVMPKVNPRWVDVLADLNTKLEAFPVNPLNSSMQGGFSRSKVRIFYSLHSAIQSTRDLIIPHALPLEEATSILKRVNDLGLSLIIHQLFMGDLNGSDEELNAVLNYMTNNLPENELRVLRYNSCDRTPYHEWLKLPERFAKIVNTVKHVKIQESPGSEVAAACGQFLVAKPIQF